MAFFEEAGWDSSALRGVILGAKEERIRFDKERNGN